MQVNFHILFTCIDSDGSYVRALMSLDMSNTVNIA
jgi:hypothetical protein